MSDGQKLAFFLVAVAALIVLTLIFTELNRIATALEKRNGDESDSSHD